MSKYIKLVAAVVLIMSFGLTGSLPKSFALSGGQNIDKDREPNLVFPVISDTQVDTNGTTDLQKLREAMGQLNEVAPNQDAFVVVGDLTDHGYIEEYDRFFSVFNEKVKPEIASFFTIGNHEYNNGLSAEDSQKRFLEQTGMESPYYHKVIKGHHFIMLSTEDGRLDGYYSKEQIAWLGKQLKQAEQDTPNQPIFVFLHQHISDTVYGSDDWGIEFNKELLYDTLNDYPQVLTFSGHSHYPLDEPKSIHQKDFTSVGTASISYMEVEHGKLQGNLPPGNQKVSQGLVVKVYDNEVVIKRRDFHNDAWTGDPWVLKLPAKKSNFKYTEDRDHVNPEFSESSAISIVDKTTKSLKIRFQQASDNILVHSYRVTAKNKQTGEVVKNYEAFSEFYRDPVPDALTLPIDGLESGTEYVIEVQAIDSFGNESEKSLQATAKTAPVEMVSASANPEAIKEGGSTTIEITLHNYGSEKVVGNVKLEAPDGWYIHPEEKSYMLDGETEKTLRFEATAPNDFSGLAELAVMPSVGGTPIQSAKVNVYVGMLIGENFGGLKSSLKPAVDEQQIDESLLGWTHKTPSGWSIVNDPKMPAGTTEWQGWSFTTKDFWTAADKQSREDFDLGQGIVAVADPDEWDDNGSPSNSGYFDSTLSSPEIDVTGGKELYLGFASHYRQEDDQTALVTVTFDNGEKQTLLRYDKQKDSDNAGGDLLNTYVTREINVPEEATSMTIHWKLNNAKNDWFWAIDDIRLDDESVEVSKDKTAPKLSTMMNSQTLQNEVTVSDTETVEFTWEAKDEESGLAEVSAVFDGESYKEGTAIDLAGKPGTYELVVTAVDKAGNVTEKSYVINVTTSADDMKALVERYKEAGEFANDRTARSLYMHLVVVDRFEENGSSEKSVKHLKGFKQLLDHQKEKELISEKIYKTLKADADYLIEKWQ